MSDDNAMRDPIEDWAPTGIDVTVPSIARIYDSLLGGKDIRA